MEIITYFAKEWRVIGQAPATFVIALFLVAGVVFAASRWSFQSRIDSKDERLRLKDDRITDLERKLAEMKEALEAPIPQTPGQADTGRYSDVLRQLTHLYVLEHDGISSEMLVGAELPPERWLNAKLAERGEGWRVRNVKGGGAEIVPANGEGV